MSMQVPNLECELVGYNPTDYPTSNTQPLGTPFVWMHSIDILKNNKMTQHKLTKSSHCPQSDWLLFTL